MTRNRTAAAQPAILLALSFALVLGACGGATAPTANPAPETAAPSAGGGAGESAGNDGGSGENPFLAGDICTLIPEDAVAFAAGGTASATETTEGDPSSCRFFFQVPSGTGTELTATTIQMLSDYELERIGAGEAAEEIEGLGDEAWARALPDTYVLYARRGDLVFRVEMGTGPDGFDPPSAARAVAEVVLDTL